MGIVGAVRHVDGDDGNSLGRVDIGTCHPGGLCRLNKGAPGPGDGLRFNAGGGSLLAVAAHGGQGGGGSPVGNKIWRT